MRRMTGRPREAARAVAAATTRSWSPTATACATSTSTRCSRFHRAHGKLATVTAVRPPARFGGLVFDGDLVAEFTEKPQIGEGWINGGFLVFEPAVLDYLDGDDDESSKRDALERLAADGQLAAYRHDGFWQCMDTLRDKRAPRSALGRQGSAPWKVWAMTRRSGTTGRRSSPARPAWSAAGWCGGCVDAGADVVCLVRDWVPQSELVARRAARAGHGRPRRRARSGAARARAGRVRDRHGHPPRGADDRRRSPTAIRSRRSRPTSRGTWALLEACRRSPLVQADRPRVVGQGLRRARDAAVRRRRRRCRARTRTTSASRART